MREYDVVVIGGGASGMMAAVVAAERGLRVLLLEKNPALGRKLSVTGGGRCNILNAEPDVRALLQHYKNAEQFLYAPFSRFGMQEAWDFFVDKKLPLVVEARNRAFPQTQKATDVVHFFEQLLKTHTVDVQCNTEVVGIKNDGDTIVGVETKAGIVTATSYVLATGGLSHPETGSTGDGLRWLSKLAHMVHTPNPALVPLVSPTTWVRTLAGTSLDAAKCTFVGKNGGRVQTRVGRMLFTHFGLSGPLVLNVAAEVRTLLQEGDVTATIDLFPGIDDALLQAKVQAVFTEHSNKALKNILKYIVPPGMSAAVASLLEPALAEEKAHSISREKRQKLIVLMRALPLVVTGTKGQAWSIVSDGGLDLREVDTKTMRSKRYKNLYLTGDLLHISRPSGGFSLQLCWTTGYVAGQSV